jgi:hypothetical protein
MKKIFYVIAAGALLMVSCNKGLSPEGQKAWNEYKELSAKFESEEAVEANFQNAGEFSEAVKQWGEAAKKMQDYILEITPEQADSFQKIAESCEPIIKKVTATMQQAQEAGVDPEAQAAEGEEEEVVEE